MAALAGGPISHRWHRPLRAPKPPNPLVQLEAPGGGDPDVVAVTAPVESLLPPAVTQSPTARSVAAADCSSL